MGQIIFVVYTGSPGYPSNQKYVFGGGKKYELSQTCNLSQN